MHAIKLENISKTYVRHSGRELLRKHVAGWFKQTQKELFYALKGVSFTLDQHESLAVLGHNGAGKSTLLSLVTGISQPDSGSLSVHGRVAALLELGSGFQSDLTGAENIHLNASLIGLTRKRTEELFDEIVDFSGVGDFLYDPLRTYSTGMVMRLAFAVAVTVDPDILILDEVLAVGDSEFQAKCFQKVLDFRAAGKTMLCVSHASSALVHMCTRAIWLDHGQLVMDGDVKSVVEAYEGRLRPAVAE